MSEQMVKHTEGYTAGADLTADEGRVAQMQAGGTIIRATSGTIAGAQILKGIVDIGGGAANGSRVTVVSLGKTKARAGGVLTRGTHRFLTCDGTGRLIAATTGDVIVAEWLDDGTAAAAAGDIIDVFVIPSQNTGLTSGDVVGPANATDHALVRFDLATGKLVQNGTVVEDDTGVLGLVTGMHAGGTAAAKNASAQVQGTSTTQGWLFPRMTTAQKGAIAAPATGLTVFDTDLGRYCVYNGAAWVTVPMLDAANALALGVAAADASAILQLDSTTRGALVPRMTTAQRNAIAAPATGLVVYDTDVPGFHAYNGAAWVRIVTLDAAGSLAVGVAAADASAIAQFDSTTKGLLPPRMTTAQKGAIAAPATGLIVRDTDVGRYEIYDGAAWVGLAEAPAAAVVDNRLVRTDGTTGRIQQSGITVSDGDALTGIASAVVTGNTQTATASLGAAAPDATSLLDVVSTTRGARPAPLHTTAQRTAIAAPADGLMSYDTDLNAPFVADAAAWRRLLLGAETRVVDWAAPGAEGGANDIATALQVRDLHGNAIAAITTVRVTATSDASTVALTETGVGGVVHTGATGAATALVITTDANGAATITATYGAAGVGQVYMVAEVLDDATLSAPRGVELNYT